MTVQIVTSDHSGTMTREDYDAITSPATIYYDLMRQRYQPPEVETPSKEYIQRSDYSPVKYSPTIEHGIHKLSKEAYEAWIEWIITFERSPEEIFFDKDELELFKLYQTEAIKEHKAWSDEELANDYRAISETPNFRNYDTKTGEYLGEALFCCKGRTKIKSIPGISASDIDRDYYRIPHSEMLHRITLSNYETAIWRKPENFDKDDKYYPNTGMKDDPDFIPPSLIESRNFVVAPPASRAYNCTFKVTYSDKKGNTQTKDFRPDLTVKKDYTGESSLKYMLSSKGFRVLNIDMYEKGKYQPDWEVDIRVSPGLRPNPTNYKKVDPDTQLGTRFLSILNDNPYSMTEFAWDHNEVVIRRDNDTGEKSEVTIVVRKLAYGIPVKDQDKIYWVYIEDANIGKYRLKKRALPPKIIDHTARYPNGDDVVYGLTLRISDNYRDARPHKKVLEALYESLYSRVDPNRPEMGGFKFLRKEEESPYSGISLHRFIRECIYNKEDYMRLILGPRYSKRLEYQEAKRQIGL